MGWCSATEVFDDVAGAVLQSAMSDEEKYNVLYKLAESLRQQDWDCEGDSAYFDYPIVQKILGE